MLRTEETPTYIAYTDSGDVYNQMCDDLCCETADVLMRE